jgi:hypothetical protein
MANIKLVLNCQPRTPAQSFNEALQSKGFNSLLLKEFLVERIKSGLVQADNKFYDKNRHLPLDELLPGGIMMLTRRKEKVSHEINVQKNLSKTHKTEEKRRKAKAKLPALQSNLASLNSRLKEFSRLSQNFQLVQSGAIDEATAQSKLSGIHGYAKLSASDSWKIHIVSQLPPVMAKQGMEEFLLNYHFHDATSFSFSYKTPNQSLPTILIEGCPNAINTAVVPLAEAFRILFKLPEVSSSSGSSHGNYGRPSFKRPEGYFDG